MTPIAPMEAVLAEELPQGEGWQYEPKWDGFRCIAVRSGDDVELWSKSGKPLGRYFPEVEAMFASLKAREFMLDGELLIITAGARVVRRIAAAPAPGRKPGAQAGGRNTGHVHGRSISCADGKAMLGSKPFVPAPGSAGKNAGARKREPALQTVARHRRSRHGARLAGADRGALDGVIAKRLDLPYRPGERAMVKVKQRRTADCVVGGFRYAVKEQGGRLAVARPL